MSIILTSKEEYLLLYGINISKNPDYDYLNYDIDV